MAYAILGASGNVGVAASLALRKAGVSVRAILRDASKADRLSSIGCEIVTADIHNAESLAKAFDRADAVQIVLPLNPAAADPPADMRDMIESLTKALEAARPKRILLISDYGAHVSHDIGIPSIFHLMEQRLSKLDGHKIFLRSAEHMHNWVRAVPVAQASGKLPTFCKTTALFPTVLASDVGSVSAELLMMPPLNESGTHIVHVEGPRRYSATDVAETLSELLNRTVVAEQVSTEQREQVLQQTMGMNLGALMAKTFDAQDKGGLVDVEPGLAEVRCGKTELKDALLAHLSS